MKVKDLIKILSELDQERDIYTYYYDNFYDEARACEINKIREIQQHNKVEEWDNITETPQGKKIKPTDYLI